MNRNRFSFWGVASLAMTSLLMAGCGEKPFAKVNGQVITKDEYIHGLEQTMAVAGPNATVPAGRLVLEQLIGKKVILAEAAQLGVVPTDDDVNKTYRYQKEMLENSQPGKNFEEELQKQGTTAEALKESLRAQLSEVAVLIKQLNLSEDKVKQFYTLHHDEFGLPARVQLRMVLVQPGSPEFAAAQKQLADPKNFTEKAARDLNIIPALKVSGGLQVLATQALPPNAAGKVQQAAPGQVIGPIDWALPNGAAKAWLKVEKKLPPYNVPIEDALPIVRLRVVQELQGSNDPKFSQVRNDIMKKKFAASFESNEAVYQTMWSALKQNAQDAGIGQEPKAPAVPMGQAAPGGGIAAPAGSEPAPKK